MKTEYPKGTLVLVRPEWSETEDLLHVVVESDERRVEIAHLSRDDGESIFTETLSTEMVELAPIKVTIIREPEGCEWKVTAGRVLLEHGGPVATREDAAADAELWLISWLDNMSREVIEDMLFVAEGFDRNDGERVGVIEDTSVGDLIDRLAFLWMQGKEETVALKTFTVITACDYHTTHHISIHEAVDVEAAKLAAREDSIEAWGAELSDVTVRAVFAGAVEPIEWNDDEE